jgi:glycosyltransferase involved in cell wall biosynthesis
MTPRTLLFLGIASNIHLKRWVSYFAGKDYTVHVATFSPDSIDPSITVHDLGSGITPRFLRYIRGYRQLRLLMHRVRPDLLHVHYVAGYGILGALTGFHPFFLTVWGSDIYRYPGSSLLRNLTVRYSIGKADIITGDSRDALEAVRRLGGAVHKCRLVQWGVDLNRFRRTGHSALRKELGFAPHNPVVIYTRGFGDRLYHPEYIIESARKVIDRFPQTRFVFLGAGRFREEMIKKSREMGVCDYTVFPGAIPHEKMPSYLSAADIYVGVPESDATSVSLLEAMAVSLPVIASDLPSNREWIVDGVNGFLLKYDDTVGLTEKILALLKDEHLRKTMGRKNRKVVRQKADHEMHMERMNEHYDCWLQRSRKNVPRGSYLP